MSCPAYWNRRVKNELSPAFPHTRIVQARCYGSERHIDGHVIPAVQPGTGDPIKAVRRFLEAQDDPSKVAVMYHRAGGFSHVHLS